MRLPATLTIALLAAILGAEPAHATTVAAAVAAVPVIYEPCPGYEQQARGCYDPAANAIYVTDRQDRETIWHERGHMFDRLALTDTDRDWFKRIVGMPHRPWTATVPGDESPAERFADMYAACKMRKRSRPNRMEMTGYGFVIDTHGARGRYRRGCVAIGILELVR